MFLPALAIYTKKNFAEHLEGGKYAALNSDEVQGAPKHNKLCERVFGQWDFAKRRSPNKSEIAIEAKLCFAFNNVGDWLENLDDESRKDVIRQSHAETTAIRAKFKQRQDTLRQRAEEVMRKKQEDARRKEQQRIAELDQLMAKVNAMGGLWSTEMKSTKV